MKHLFLSLLFPATLLAQSDTIIQTRVFPAQYLINGQACGAEEVRLHLEQTDLARACAFHRGMKITHVGATLAAVGGCCIIGGAMFNRSAGAQLWNVGAFGAFSGAVVLWIRGGAVKKRALRLI